MASPLKGSHEAGHGKDLGLKLWRITLVNERNPDLDGPMVPLGIRKLHIFLRRNTCVQSAQKHETSNFKSKDWQPKLLRSNLLGLLAIFVRERDICAYIYIMVVKSLRRTLLDQ